MRTLKSLAANLLASPKMPLIVLVAVAYLMTCLVCSLLIFSEYFNTGPVQPISTGKYLFVFFFAAPLLLLVYGLLEAAIEGVIALLIAGVKALRR